MWFGIFETARGVFKGNALEKGSLRIVAVFSSAVMDRINGEFRE